MIHAVLTFASDDLEDDRETLQRNVNGIGGCRCANWIRDHLRSNGFSVPAEPIPEDWGWALVVNVGPDRFLVGCGAADDLGESCWRVMIGDNFNRGLFPATRRRRTAALVDIASCVGAFLEAQPSVRHLAISAGQARK